MRTSSARRFCLRTTLWLAVGLASLAPGRPALAAPTLRLQVDQKGDFLLVGNTLAHDCAAGVPAPVAGGGTVGACGTSTADSAPDVFWRSDQPMVGQALASNAIAVVDARSTAILTVPAGATVTHARLYWAALRNAGSADLTAVLEREGVFSSPLNADFNHTVNPGGGQRYYESTADVTAIVQANGSGAYRVGGVDSVNLVNLNSPNPFAGWAMVVFYQLDTEPPRNLALFDGLDEVQNGAPASATLSGFLVPNAGFDAKLGLVAYEGDETLTGDQFLFNGNVLSDAQNPAANFFNSTRSFLAAPVSVVGDLPQLTGTPASMSGVDLDVVNITPYVSGGQTSAAIQATSTGDHYFLGAFVTSISTFAPDFSTSEKTFSDLNGGLVQPGDVIEYSIVGVNTGNDTAVNTVLTDPLPPGVTYVPGSIQITAGANVGAKTDAIGDDQGEYVAATDTVVVRLGAGANGTQGGTMAPGESSTVTFQVTIDPSPPSQIDNQATITASGAQGAPPGNFPTDGNGSGSGQPPTTIDVDSDGDGLTDTQEGILGTDPLDPDTDGDGLLDGVEAPGAMPIDTDNDGTIDALDPDDDGDAIPTATEIADGATFGLDVDGDGFVDWLDTDADGDGKPDTVELTGDVDGDGIPNYLDPNDADGQLGDNDGDGVPNGVETTLGTDPNNPDSDGDGIGDGVETNGGQAIDTDMDGTIDALDLDSDDDSILDAVEGTTDSDSDGISDWRDPDDDNDTIPTLTEATDGATFGDDVDMDGSVDWLDTDADGDGKLDMDEGTGDIDGDGIPNYLDPDDADGLLDNDGDGLTNGTEKQLGTNPDDPDSDGDGIGDFVETDGGMAIDTDGDGEIDALDLDSDDDTLLDSVEGGTADTDMDGKPNWRDDDDDDDGIPTATEVEDGGRFGDDVDDDGDKDWLDTDADGDGKLDADEGTGDGDGDGIPNYLDPDDGPSTSCTTDADCTIAGQVCDIAAGMCVTGCKNGTGCPSGQVCSSEDETIGQCEDAGAGGGPATSSASGLNDDPIVAEGGGCACSAPGDPSSGAPLGALAALAGLALAHARRRRL